jgi:hypothetical protein
MQISLPIKTKAKQQLYQYALMTSPTKYIKGKAELMDNWEDMKKGIGAENSLVYTLKDLEGMILVNE